MSKKRNNEFNVAYTNMDIMEKLEKIHEQTTKTNGRVTLLESNSLGLWISKHPLKFAMYILLFTVIVISDIRHPLINLVVGLL